MAKKSMIAREVKRQKLVDKYAAKRAELKAIATTKPARWKSVSRPAEAGQTATQLSATRLAQPLPAHRASSRLLP